MGRSAKTTLVLAALWVLLPSAAAASPPSSPSGSRIDPLSHREVPTDAYLPTPAQFPGAPTTGQNTVVFGKFVSVQVNVNASGSNITRDAANEPSLAIDPLDPSRLVIGWRQFDNFGSNFRQGGWAYSHDGGSAWTFPGVLQTGVFRSDPVLAADADGNFYYYSLRAVDAADIFKSIDGGVTWAGPFPAFGGDKPWMAIDRTLGIGRNNIYATWTPFFSCCPGHFTRSSDGGSSFLTPIGVPGSPFWGTVAVGPDGEIFVSGASGVVARSTSTQDPTAAPVFELIQFVDLGGFVQGSTGPNPDGLLGQVWIDTDKSSGLNRGNVYLLASVSSYTADPMDVMFTRSVDGGATWSPPVRVNDDATTSGAWQWFGTMSVAPNGRIDAVWNDTRALDRLNICQLYYAFSVDGGLSWSTNVPVSPLFNSNLGWPGGQRKLGDYYHMISDNGGANVAYAATFNDEQDIYFLRVPMDCNDNDIEDDEDVASGASTDCNGNFIPDECEDDLDCNNNGVQDICDLADGTSLDCNRSNTPDECELAGNDCNGNFIPDECEDCNENGAADQCDIDAGTSVDCNENAVPDECEPDCNANGVADECDLAAGAEDCNENQVPDECELSTCAGPTGTCIAEGDCCLSHPTPGCACSGCCDSVCALDAFCCDFVWDEVCVALAAADLRCGCGSQSALLDCNRNGQLDQCEIADGTAADCNNNGTPDECERDCNTNAQPDDCDIADGLSPDCNSNGVPDECDLAVSDASDATDNCEDAGLICPGTVLGGTTTGASSDGAATCAVSDLSPDVWIRYRPSADGQLTVSLCGSAYDTALSVHSGCPGNVQSELSCNDDFCDLQSAISVVVTAGVQYWIRIAGFGGETGNFVIELLGPPCEPDATDCNDNAIPDSCEQNEDCNANGVQDICDIATTVSGDCNDNLRPDECETDSDGDGVIDACDECPNDDRKTVPEICGCGVIEDAGDLDGDTVPNCLDGCPRDSLKTAPGFCGCHVLEDASDVDGDRVIACFDNCRTVFNPTQEDSDGDGLGDRCDLEVIPTVSIWGMLVLAILLAIGGKVYGRRSARS